MKKYLFIAAAALAMLASCQVKEELAFNQKQNTVAEGGIHFDVYTQRGVFTKAGTPGDITNANIGTKDGYGFGVFAYYTAGEKYDVNAKPNFMYNQQVYKEGDAWKYEPVKYWPNEYGNAAISDEVDYVTFFAYAPWTNIEPTTGEVIVDSERDQKYNIISVNKNTATGDPMIKYVVDTDPATSVDLLWGVAASNADGNYSAIDTNYNKTNLVKTGMPFIDLMKPGNPKEDKISFNLKHSLAKVKFTIDYVKDDFTPEGATAANPAVIDTAETRIFVRSFAIDGWATKGALNLNNTEEGQPLWKDFDGVKDLAFNQLIFNDGRKDGKEGDVNGAQTNEENQGLNPDIIENFGAPTLEGGIYKFNGTKNGGVTEKAQLLFGGDESKNGGYFYVIPRNGKEPVNVTIVYDVETIDGKLAGMLSDGATHGLSIENVISKNAILGENKDFEAGKQYLIKIHIGMTSVKIDAVVTDWVPTNDENVDLPDNQPMPCWTIPGVPGYFLTDPALGIDVPVTLFADEAGFNEALAAGPLKDYYFNADTVKNADNKFFRAGAARYNAALDKYDDNSGLGFIPAAEWEAAGYVRCWKGMLQDHYGDNAIPAITQFFVLDLATYPLANVRELKFAVDGADAVALNGVDAAWIAAKIAKGDTWLWGNVMDEFNINGAATKIVAKYFYENAVYHETIQ